jgi:16S rRNA (uracil1498-N3)-methyltransferase
VVERSGRAPLGRDAITLFAPERPVPGTNLTLGEGAARHARVRRVDVGVRVVLLDGEGTRAEGTLVRVSRRSAVVEVEEAAAVEAPPAVHLFVPVADRDRMLWLAEKCAELAATSWRPVLWRRSRSVTARGEGMMFHAKVRARMIAALEQSGGAWLPTLYPEAKVDHALAATPGGARLLLDPAGAPMVRLPIEPPVSIALGPEGGLEPAERQTLVAAGWTPATLGGNTLRFETAGVAALAIVRAILAFPGGG